MESENQHRDTYDKINLDILTILEKVRNIKKKIRDTPWYHFRERWRLYKEIKSIEKQTDDIGKRLQIIEKSAVQTVKRT